MPMPYKRNLRVAVFVDAANTYICTTSVWKDKKVDYQKLLEWAVGGSDRTLVRAIMYAVKHVDHNDPMTSKKMDNWAGAMNNIGYEVKMKEPTRYANSSKADWDITIAIDIVRIVDMVDMVVLVSGDGDFEEVVRYCQERGRIVRVIGVDSSTSRKLKDVANIYTPVSEYILMNAPRREERRHEDRSTPAQRPQPTGNQISSEDRKNLDKETEKHESENANIPGKPS